MQGTIKQKHGFSVAELLIMLAVAIAALAFRLIFFDFVSGDYTGFLSGWYNTLSENGGFGGIGLSIGDYTPPYIYLTALMTYIPIKSLYAIKIFSCLFDVLLAVGGFLCVQKATEKKLYAYICYAALLFWPTVVINSAAWAQCDVIYTSFLVLCVFFLLRDKPWLATLFYGIAFSIKLQSIFLAPLLLLLFLLKKIKLRHLMVIPAVYIVMILPSFFAGRSFFELLTIYFRQAGEYKGLTLSAPNIYAFLKVGAVSDKISFAGIILCGTVTLISILVLWYLKPKCTKNLIIITAVYFSVLLPFLLPHMHDRYFFVTDVLTVIYACTNRKRFFLPVVSFTASIVSYLRFLLKETTIDLRLMTILMAVVLAVAAWDLLKEAITTRTREKGSFKKGINIKAALKSVKEYI